VLLLCRKLQAAPPQPLLLPVPKVAAAASEAQQFIGDFNAGLQECSDARSAPDGAEAAQPAQPNGMVAEPTAQPAKVCTYLCTDGPACTLPDMHMHMHMHMHMYAKQLVHTPF
jgi:hypothetical protein